MRNKKLFPFSWGEAFFYVLVGIALWNIYDALTDNKAWGERPQVSQQKAHRK